MTIDGDLNAHVQTYAGFTNLLKWGAVACFATAVIVIFLIAN